MGNLYLNVAFVSISRKKMVYFWSSFLGATFNEPDADFTWTSCLYCGTRGAKVIMRDHEQVCEKRPVCCVYQSNGCPFQRHAEDHRRHLVYCQFKPRFATKDCQCGVEEAYGLHFDIDPCTLTRAAHQTVCRWHVEKCTYCEDD